MLNVFFQRWKLRDANVLYSSYGSYQFISSLQTRPSLPCFAIMREKTCKHLPLASWGSVKLFSRWHWRDTEEGTFLSGFKMISHSHSEGELQPVTCGMPSVTLSFNSTHRQLGQPMGLPFQRVLLVPSPTHPPHFWSFPCPFCSIFYLPDHIKFYL